MLPDSSPGVVAVGADSGAWQSSQVGEDAQVARLVDAGVSSGEERLEGSLVLVDFDSCFSGDRSLKLCVCFNVALYVTFDPLRAQRCRDWTQVVAGRLCNPTRGCPIVVELCVGAGEGLLHDVLSLLDAEFGEFGLLRCGIIELLQICEVSASAGKVRRRAETGKLCRPVGAEERVRITRGAQVVNQGAERGVGFRHTLGLISVN